VQYSAVQYSTVQYSSVGYRIDAPAVLVNCSIALSLSPSMPFLELQPFTPDIPILPLLTRPSPQFVDLIADNRILHYLLLPLPGQEISLSDIIGEGEGEGNRNYGTKG
jgi:hypothetical protein